MNRSLCLASLLAALIAVVIISTLTADVEATPRYFRAGGRRSFGRGRVWSYRRPWNFRYFFRRPRYYGKTKPPKPTTMPATMPTPATGPTSMAATSMPPSTEPPTMCAPVQTCNVTDALDALTSALYSVLFVQTEGSARINAMEVLDEFLGNSPRIDCASTLLSGNVLTATLNPGAVPFMELYQLELLLNADLNRVLQATFTTRDFPVVGQLRVILTFAGRANLVNDNENLLSIEREFRPPGEATFFPFPLRTQTCETRLECGELVTQPPVPPTEPENVQLPNILPVLTGASISEASEVSGATCTIN